MDGNLTPAFCLLAIFFHRAFADTEKAYNFALPFFGIGIGHSAEVGKVLEKTELKRGDTQAANEDRL